MSKQWKRPQTLTLPDWTLGRGGVPTAPKVIILAAAVGVIAGYGAVLFTVLIDLVTTCTVEPFVLENGGWTNKLALCLVPAVGLLFVSWFTRRFALEAQGHGVPEVITAIARSNGVIRPRVSIIKILASGLCIGTGGSIGREGPIVQIGSSLGSLGGQAFKLSPQHVKVLVAAGAAAGISATFNAPIAGVMFASEIILGNFAIGSLTPIVIASVLADVVQAQSRTEGFEPAFPQLHYMYLGGWEQLPSYVVLGLVCGLAAVGFTKLLYLVEDASQRWLPRWWLRALVCGGLVGMAGALYTAMPPAVSPASEKMNERAGRPLPPLFGVGYDVVGHALHIETQAPRDADRKQIGAELEKVVKLDAATMLSELWWLLPLALLKPFATSLTLGGGGSGGIFAPSLFIGATLGASFGIVSNLLIPEFSANPGVYAIVGMGAVVAGTTHGVLSAILIVYELTNDYRIILPIMAAAGLSSILAEFIDPDSIYYKKLTRRGDTITRGHKLHQLEHIMVRDVMVCDFPSVRTTDNLAEIDRVARAHPNIKSLPVMGGNDQLVGIIHAEELHRVLDTDVVARLVNADDIATKSPVSISADANLIEALRDFGLRDVDTLPVINGAGGSPTLVGLLLRADVTRRYREELLRNN